MSVKQIQLEIFQADHKNKKITLADNGKLLEKSFEPKFPTQLCLKSACLVIIIIISFVLGVERGKVISKSRISNSFLADTKPQNIIPDVTGQVAIRTKGVAVKTDAIQRIPPATKKLQTEEKDDELSDSKYVIQVVTYKKNSSYVDREIAKLKRNGYTAITIPSGEYMQICAGKFSDEKNARIHLKKLKQTYKDCRIRKI